MAEANAFGRAVRAQAARRGPGPLRRFMLARMAGLAYPGTKAEQLLLAPQELRTADPSFATELYNGHFGLAGRLAELGARSPFAIEPPSEAWAQELYGFGWLRHLRAAGSALSREQAKALVRDFVKLHRSINGVAWQPEIVARRVISWLSNSVLVLDTGDPKTYDAFLRALTDQLRYLSASYRDTPDGVPRLVTLMALLYAGLCIAEQQAVVDRYVKPFCKELDRQILPDGGHISRNPMALIEILLDLLPLRQCFVARDRPAPKALSDAIDRAMPMLRFFRMGDGTLARFNGSGATPTDSLATVLAYDDVEGSPLRAAPNSGYLRLERGSTVVICDVEKAPPSAVSRSAHAGCLSFEMSSNGIPIVVNCGAPGADHDDWLAFARSTPAHSTATLEDASSAEFSGARGTLAGPPHVNCNAGEEQGALLLNASHDGYVSRFGVTHARQIFVGPDGDIVSGEDRLAAPRALRGDASVSGGAYAVRFHLHPNVTAQPSPDGQSVLLFLRGGAWRFTANAPEIALEESVFLADERGPRQSTQIVLSGIMGEDKELRLAWSIERVAESGNSDVSPDDGGDAA